MVIKPPSCSVIYVLNQGNQGTPVRVCCREKNGILLVYPGMTKHDIGKVCASFLKFLEFLIDLLFLCIHEAAKSMFPS
jgi:hypothetical protein